MYTIAILIYSLSFSTSNFIHQASGLDIFDSYYESILAKNHQYHSSHWDLDSGVREVVLSEFSAGEEASIYSRMTYQFNPQGYLQFWMKGDSSNADYFFEHRIFAFGEDGQLQKITQYEQHQQSYTFSRSFGPDGYLIGTSYQSKVDYSLNYRSQIQYADEHQSMKIDYQYKTPKSHWERKKAENYRFTFDESGFLIAESMQGQYSYTTTYKRNAKGLVRNSHRIAACFPSNSCVNLKQNFTYDRAGNLIKLSSQDLTVRNSIWTLGNNFEAKYNAQNLIVEKSVSNPWGPSYAKVDAKQNYRYEYIFDERGNWIKQTEYVGEQPTKIIERKISYY